MEKLISKVYFFVTNKKTIVGFLFLFSVTFIYSLWHRYIQSDEYWFGEQAYWLLNEGVVKIKSMPGILDFDKRMLVYHQLFIYMGAGLIKIFGWSAYILKTFTIVIYSIFFVLFFYYFKKQKEYNYPHFIASSLLILACPIMVMQSFMFRPEIMVMTLGFISYFFLHLYLKGDKTRFLIFGALSAGLAFLTTFNGLAFPVAGFAILLLNKKFKALILYCFLTFAVCSLFTFELWRGNSFETFLYQFRNWPTWKFGTTYMDQNIGSLIIKKLIALTNIFQFFFWSDRVMFFSLIFFVSLFSRLKYFWKEHCTMLIYLASIMLSLDLLGSFIAERYLIYVFPYMAVISGIAIVDSIKKENVFYKSLILILILIQIGFLSKTFGFIISLNNDHIVRHRSATDMIPEKNATVVAPWSFIFNEIGKHNFISYKAIEYFEDELGKKMNGPELFDLIRGKYKAKYIIVQRTIKNEPDWYPHWFDNMDVLMKNEHFFLHNSNADFFIFKSK